MISGPKAFPVAFCCVCIAVLHLPDAQAQPGKVNVCHSPPGNPANVQTLSISEEALPAHLEHGDTLGTCSLTGTSRGKDAACTCPKPGVWRVTNGVGLMECNVLGIKRKIRGEDKNDGAIWILNDDCSTIFSEAYEKHREDVIMDRGRDCLFFGFAPGTRDGAEVIFDGAYKVETEERITGEYYMEMSSMGADCTGFTPFEIDFLRPLKQKEYSKLEKTMQKELEKARKTLVDHHEQITDYLEKSDGGKPYGGRKDNP